MKLLIAYGKAREQYTIYFWFCTTCSIIP